jgi:hypothetical protein
MSLGFYAIFVLPASGRRVSKTPMHLAFQTSLSYFLCSSISLQSIPRLRIYHYPYLFMPIREIIIFSGEQIRRSRVPLTSIPTQMITVNA